MVHKGIINIGIEHIHPHPNNPRKNIGDVSELAESIKKNGIMQNLTVIPIEGKTGEYMAIIGHRRHAAAKLAGISEVPCRVIEGMSMKEQVSTMLEENMQRDDLTIYEQAQGFQMMLDLGETEEAIAEKTGFSKTTIRRRLNIAKLDQEELRKKNEDEGFQLSLKDLYELEKIPDVKLRDKILKEATDSNNLASRAQSCADELKRKENEKKFKILFKKLGIKPAPDSAKNEMYSGKWDTVNSFELSKDVPETIKLKKDVTKCFYIVNWREMKIISKRVKEKRELTPEEQRAKERDKRKRQLKSIQKEMAAERKDFIRLAIEKKFLHGKKDASDLQMEIFCLLMSCDCWMSQSTLLQFLYDKESWRLEDEERNRLYEEIKKIPLIYLLLVYAEKAVADKDVAEWNGTYHKKNGKILMEMNSILEPLGFSYSKEEFSKVADGTHELYEDSKK